MRLTPNDSNNQSQLFVIQKLPQSDDLHISLLEAPPC